MKTVSLKLAQGRRNLMKNDVFTRYVYERLAGWKMHPLQCNQRPLRATLFTCLLLLLLTLPGHAMDSDREQPIHVEADQLELREKEGISIYEGNVKLVQGTLEIESDRLVIHFNQNNELTLMEMTGKLATFRQLDNDRQPLYGEAEQIDYSEAEGLLIMRRSAYLDRAGDDIRSELIRFNTITSGIEAGGEQSDDRVKMIIKPRSPANGAAATGAEAGDSGAND